MGKQEGKKLTKIKNKHQRETASPSPSGGGDVRGYGGMRKEGMCLAGYGMLGVGEMEGGRFKAKSSWVNSQGLKFGGQKYALSHADRLSVNSEIRSLKHTIHLSIIRKFVVFSTQFIYLLIRKFVVF